MLNTMQRDTTPANFSLILGGPLFELWRRTGLSGDNLELLGRRIPAMVALAWVPLLILSMMEGNTSGGGIAKPFLYDIKVHLRFLLAVPLLLAAEEFAHRRMSAMVRNFVNRGLVHDAARERLYAAATSTRDLCNSKIAEAMMLAIVYGVGVLFIWRSQAGLDLASWYGVPVEGRLHPSLAGWWLGLVSLPLIQFLLLRWFYRLFIWTRFLWQVSRIDLDIEPRYPDGVGGLGFLGWMSYQFIPLLLALGVMIAAMIADRIFYDEAELLQFNLQLIGITGLVVLVILGPLLSFAPKLEAAKRAGTGEYALLVARYMREFDDKWQRGRIDPDERLVGSMDIQSMADLGNSYAVVNNMRWVPFKVHHVLSLSIALLLPVIPLSLTMVSVEDFLKRLLNVIF